MIGTLLKVITALSIAASLIAPHLYAGQDCSDIDQIVSALSKNAIKRYFIVAEEAQRLSPVSSSDQRQLNKFLKELRIFSAKLNSLLYDSSDSRINAVLYPASGYDAATAVWLIPDARQYVLIDSVMPFINPARGGYSAAIRRVVYYQENVAAAGTFAVGSVSTARIEAGREHAGGALALILGRMRAYYPRFKPIQIFAVRNAGHVHGVINFIKDPHSPIQSILYIHGDLKTMSFSSQYTSDNILSVGPAPHISLSLFKNIDAVILRSSMGVMDIHPYMNGVNPTRVELFKRLRRNRGLLIEGFGIRAPQQGPQDDAWEINSLDHLSGQYRIYTDFNVKFSYIPGIRAIRFVDP